VFSGAERWRRWGDLGKRALVEAAFAPGAVACEVARAADVAASQIYRWRKQFASERVADFSAVTVAPGEAAQVGPARGPTPRCGAGDRDQRRCGANRGGCAAQADDRGPALAWRMIPAPSAVRVWIATATTDMRRGMHGLVLQVQQGLKRDPHGGDLYVFRGRCDDLIKILWHDGFGMSLDTKRLDRSRFVLRATASDAVPLTPAQLGYMLEGTDWRHPHWARRPTLAG
jgi:transposase